MDEETRAGKRHLESQGLSWGAVGLVGVGSSPVPFQMRWKGEADLHSASLQFDEMARPSTSEKEAPIESRETVGRDLMSAQPFLFGKGGSWSTEEVSEALPEVTWLR